MKISPPLSTLLIASLAATLHARAQSEVVIEASQVEPFKVALVDGSPQWISLPPKGIGVTSWDSAGTGTVTRETVEANPASDAFVIRNTGGEASCMMTIGEPLFDARLKSGKTYELTVSYATSQDASPTLGLKFTGPAGEVTLSPSDFSLAYTADQRQVWKKPLDPSDRKWIDVKTRISLTGEATLGIEFLGGPVGEDHFLAVRRIAVSVVE